MSRSSRCGTVAGATLRDRQYPDQFRDCDYVTRPPAKIAASRRVVVVSPHPPPNVSKSAGNHYAASPGCADQRLSLGLREDLGKSPAPNMPHHMVAELAPDRWQRLGRTLLVRLHQSRMSRHIAGKDRSETGCGAITIWWQFFQGVGQLAPLLTAASAAPTQRPSLSRLVVPRAPPYDHLRSVAGGLVMRKYLAIVAIGAAQLAWSTSAPYVSRQAI